MDNIGTEKSDDVTINNPNEGSNSKKIRKEFDKTIDKVVEGIVDPARVFVKESWKGLKKGVENKLGKKKNDAEKIPEEKVKEQVKLDDKLKRAIDDYNAAYNDLQEFGMSLFRQRERSSDLIGYIEKLINSIANHPKIFDKEFEEIITEKENFMQVCEYAENELKLAKTSAAGSGAGLAAGASIAFIAPTAAMWIATTFGTASTGTAISALSGAAATKAALAWLGGGALAAGGGGMAAGNALLAMCGPIGWTIAGASILTSVILFAANKHKTNKKKKEELEAALTNTTSLKESVAKLEILYNETNDIRNKLKQSYDELMNLFGKDYLQLNEEDKARLATMVNNTKSLAATLGKTI